MDVTLVPFHPVAHERYVVYFEETAGANPRLTRSG